jgi:hypothetical protein
VTKKIRFTWQASQPVDPSQSYLPEVSVFKLFFFINDEKAKEAIVER